MAVQELDVSGLWIPQPGSQRECWECPVETILFAGSRGGGKTDLGIGLWLRHMMVAEDVQEGLSSQCRGLVIRKTIKEMRELRDRAAAIYKDQAVWRDTKSIFEFVNGAQIEFTYLERPSQASRFQGRNLTFVWFEEVGQFADPRPLDEILAAVRSTSPIPKRILFTCNPAGAGHSWLKRRFVDPWPAGRKILEEETKRADGSIAISERIYIPSKTEENQIMLKADPDYSARIRKSTYGQPHLEAAWMNGSWDIIAGGMFDSVWDPKFHVLPDFVDVPRHWEIRRSYDWGSSQPFCIGWYAKTDGNPVKLSDGSTRRFARGSIIKLAEWYGASDDESRNEGLHMLERDIAEKARQRQDALFPHHEVKIGVADMNIFVPDGAGRRDVDEWNKVGMRWKQINDKSRVPGWRKIREMLVNAATFRPEAPGLYICESCIDTLSLLPVTPRGEVFKDDIRDGFPDHCLDELRYFVMHKAGKGLSYSRVA